MFKAVQNFFLNKFKKDLSVTYLVSMTTMLLGFIIIYVINVFFSVEIYGSVVIIISSVGLFSNLVTANSSESVVRFFKREIILGKLENAKMVVYLGFFIDLITGVLLVIFIYIYSKNICTYFLKNENYQHGVIMYSFIVFFTFSKSSMIGYFQAKEHFIKIQLLGFIETVFKLILIFVFIKIGFSLSLNTIIYAYIVSSFFSFAVTLFYFIKLIRIEFYQVKFKINKILLKEYLNHNYKVFLSFSLKAGSTNIDNLIVAYFIDSKAVGTYEVIKKIISPVQIISSPYSSILYPKMIEYFEKRNFIKFQNLIKKNSINLGKISLLFVSLSIGFLPLIFSILNVSFKNQYYFIFIICSLTAILGVLMWWVRIFSNVVNPNYSLYLNILATIYQLSVTIILSKLYGIEGMLMSLLFLNILLIYIWIKIYKNYVKSNLSNVFC